MTAQGLERLPGAPDRDQPKLVILCLGGNGMLHKIDDRTIASNLRAMVREMRDRGVAVLLVGVPRPTLQGSPPKFYADIAHEFGVPCEGRVLKDVLYERDMKSDPIHPNAKGYRCMAEAVAELLCRAGAV